MPIRCLWDLAKVAAVFTQTNQQPGNYALQRFIPTPDR
jgi:hypothetical protein